MSYRVLEKMQFRSCHFSQWNTSLYSTAYSHIPTLYQGTHCSMCCLGACCPQTYWMCILPWVIPGWSSPDLRRVDETFKACFFCSASLTSHHLNLQLYWMLPFPQRGSALLPTYVWACCSPCLDTSIHLSSPPNYPLQPDLYPHYPLSSLLPAEHPPGLWFYGTC